MDGMFADGVEQSQAAGVDNERRRFNADGGKLSLSTFTLPSLLSLSLSPSLPPSLSPPAFHSPPPPQPPDTRARARTASTHPPLACLWNGFGENTALYAMPRRASVYFQEYTVLASLPSPAEEYTALASFAS